MQPHRHIISRRIRQTHLHIDLPLFGLAHALNHIEALQQSDQDIPRLRKCELLPNADPRSTVERQVLPSGLALVPAIRTELIRISAPQIRPTVHHVGAVEDGLALLDVDGVGARGTTARGEGGVADSRATVTRDNRVETEDLVEEVLQGTAGLEIGKGDVTGGRVGAEFRENGGAQGGEVGRVAGEEEDAPGEEGGSGIATGEEDVKELGAQFDGVAGGLGQTVQEDIVAGGFLLGVGVEGGGDEAVDVGVDGLVDRAAFLVVDDPVELLETGALGRVPLAAVELGREVVLGNGAIAEGGGLALDALAEEELSRGVHGQAEEDGLDVGGGGPAGGVDGHGFHGDLDVTLLEIEVADLVAGELRTEESARPRPVVAIGSELDTS